MEPLIKRLEQLLNETKDRDLTAPEREEIDCLLDALHDD